MTEECPHCRRRVISSSEGICPACNVDVNDTTGVDSSQQVVFVTPESRMPDLCIVCGKHTGRRSKVTDHSSPMVYYDYNPASTTYSSLCGRRYARHGARLAQRLMRLASSSLTNVSVAGSSVTSRPSIQAMAAA